MDKFVIITTLLTAVLLIVAGGAIVYSSSAGGVIYSQDDALNIAKQFVAAESTFKFDGMEDSLNIKPGTTKTIDTYEIIAEFTSRSAGFGDRSEMMTAQVLTPHEAVITVEKGKVIAAVMDGQWDMITQTNTQGPSTMPRLNDSITPPTVPDNSSADRPLL